MATDQLQAMQQFNTYMEILRRLAKEPEGNLFLVAELGIIEYLRADIAALRSTLQRLDKAAGIEADTHPSESPFWNANPARPSIGGV